MKPYEYQILRYVPDQVSGEFLNVGVILYGNAEQELYAEFASSRQRMSAFFQGIESAHILKRLRNMQAKAAGFQKQLKQELVFPSNRSVTFFAEQLIPKDDSALQFSEVKKGIALSAAAAFEDLKYRLLFKWTMIKGVDYRSDTDVWKERYKIFFENAGIAEKLVARTVTTKSDSIAFEQAYKNGIWNYFQPLNLNLKKDESIRNKVYKWRGILSEIGTADEALKVIFLTEMPSADHGLDSFIQEHLNLQIAPNIEAECITPEEIPALLSRFTPTPCPHETYRKDQ
ncbi:MAG: DUF3037 domain-containing protein [Balneolales bacterium]|nr:DUF3037 domain-containing protein [Balneolales bacterium]